MKDRIFIVDTNVLVAGLITSAPDSPTAKIPDAMLRGDIFYLLSPELLREYQEVLRRPRLARLHGLDDRETEQILTEITANAIWREPLADAEYPPPDPQDAHLWKLLAAEPDALLITGDRLLIEKPDPRHSVISPATWDG